MQRRRIKRLQSKLSRMKPSGVTRRIRVRRYLSPLENLLLAVSSMSLIILSKADETVSSPQPPRMPKRKKAAKAAPAGMAVSLAREC